MTTDQQLKTCPFCAEEILAAAIKCKHCKEFIDEAKKVITQPDKPKPVYGEDMNASATNGPNPSEVVNNELVLKSNLDTILPVLFIVALLTVFLGTPTFIVLSVFSSIWVAIDTKAIGIKKGQLKGFLNVNPIEWVICTLLLWMIAFPCYLLKRHELQKLNNAKGISTNLTIGISIAGVIVAFILWLIIQKS